MKTALITGITGQDGSYLSKFLLSKRYIVVGTVRSYLNKNEKNFKYLNIVDKVLLEEVDLLDTTTVIKLFNKYDFDEVYNLAAQSSVGKSFSNPFETINFNNNSLLNILEAIRVFAPKTRFYQAI